MPIEGFTMTGSGRLDIGTDGFIDGVDSHVSSGTIVVPEQSIPFSTPSAYAFSGNWALGGDDTIDFTAIPIVRAECTTDSLRLQPTPSRLRGPMPRWRRSGAAGAERSQPQRGAEPLPTAMSFHGALRRSPPGGIRTPGHAGRNRVLCPLSYGGKDLPSRAPH